MAKTKRQRQFSLSHLEQRAREEAAANEAAIYGDLLPMVHFIRRRGWVVFKEGYQFRVGTKLMGPESLKDVYLREMRRAAREREERLVAEGQDRETPDSDNRKPAVPRRPPARRNRPRNKARPSGCGAGSPNGIEEGAT